MAVFSLFPPLQSSSLRDKLAVLWRRVTGEAHGNGATMTGADVMEMVCWLFLVKDPN